MVEALRSESSFLEIYEILDNQIFLTNTNVIYHYTSLATLHKILSSKSLHLTDCAFMNDYSEFEFGIDALKKLMKKYHKSSDEQKVIDGLDVIKNIKHQNRVFVGAFTLLKDSLNQWRSYASQATGIAIGLKVTKIEEYCKNNDISFGSVIYSDNFEDIFGKLSVKIMQLMKKSLPNKNKSEEEERALKAMISYLLGMTSFMKHPGFEEEKEIRIVAGSFNQEIKKKFHNGLYIPYCELDFGGSFLEMIDEIWIGPAAKQELVHKSVDLMVQEYDMSGRCEIKVSMIPYRLLSDVA